MQGNGLGGCCYRLASVADGTEHKQWRGIATRYDKLASVYRGVKSRGGVVLRAITIWLAT